MAVMQATAATTPNSSPARKLAAGKNIKWNRKLPGTTPAPLKGHSEQLENNHILVFGGVSLNGELQYPSAIDLYTALPRS
jgi:hypothetical protein